MRHLLFLSKSLLTSTTACCADTPTPIVSGDVVFREQDGVVVEEAEHFSRQTLVMFARGT